MKRTVRTAAFQNPSLQGRVSVSSDSVRIRQKITRVRLACGERSYSQEGEDRILARLFAETPHRTGFYVDVGAHDPMRFSNTYLFYRQGWHGVNIDATPGSMQPFEKHRPRDTNVETGIGSDETTAPFYMFNEPALNSFDKELSESRNIDPYKIIEVVYVPVSPLRHVLHGHLPGEKLLSFLNVDVEGRDLDVLNSNDWSVFRPTFVLAECLGSTMEEAIHGPVSELMFSVGYRFIAKTANTAFYQIDE
jgi:hypothetical protein